MKLLIIQVAALSESLDIPGFQFHKTQSVFPAVTCSVQASFKTASYPESHGMIANGLMFRELHKPMFWEQASSLVTGERIWHNIRQQGKKVAMLFWQQSLGEDIDILLSPAPIHKHHGGMIMDCYSKPAGLYKELCKQIGSSFSLMKYWGPLASATVGNWIVDATIEILKTPAHSPDLCFTYLPSLDYDLQRYPRNHKKCKQAFSEVKQQVSNLITNAQQLGYEVVVFGDYHISPVNQAIYPNRVLKAHGLLATRDIKNMQYPDFHTSQAFAVADHEISHVYIKNPANIDKVKKVLETIPGIAHVYCEEELKKLHIKHKNSGELLLVAANGYWFAYPWWQETKNAPDYATHIDIHNKPGYDPCELFSGFPPVFTVSQNTSKIMGSHGKTGEGCDVLWGSSFDLKETPNDLVELAQIIKNRISE